jgi:hypothetical protein
MPKHNTDNKGHKLPAFYPKKRDKLSRFLQSVPALKKIQYKGTST